MDYDDIMKKGGFDVVLGNPPYGNILSKLERRIIVKTPEIPHFSANENIIAGNKFTLWKPDIPAEFSRPEVLSILREYYGSLEEKVEVKLHGHATGDAKK